MGEHPHRRERAQPPAHLVETVDGAIAIDAAAEMLRAFIEQGMPPDEVAGKVLDAIRAERFWILTHDDETDFWVDVVNRRLRSVAGAVESDSCSCA